MSLGIMCCQSTRFHLLYIQPGWQVIVLIIQSSVNLWILFLAVFVPFLLFLFSPHLSAGVGGTISTSNEKNSGRSVIGRMPEGLSVPHPL